MDAQDGDEDVAGSMSDNSGKKLGTNMKNERNPAPEGETVKIYYKKGSILRYSAGSKKKTIRIYEEVVDEEEYKFFSTRPIIWFREMSP